jgi:molybdopterin-containing oxidoreductase family membrane subunit
MADDHTSDDRTSGDLTSYDAVAIDPGPNEVLGPGHNYGTVTDKISGVILRPMSRTPWQMFAGFAVAFLLVNLFLVAVTWLFVRGVGVWGVVIPVAWGFAIVNFVWWIGIGHAGTLISAILLLLKQDWRTSINRFSEAMTLFAVACAGMFPILHLGRPWLAYWLLPYPNTMWLWPQPRSPLIWDVFAVSTYATVSLIFWFTGLIPDLATMRDKAKSPLVQKLFGMLAMGWRGSARHWARYQKTYLLLAGLSTPLVVSVHSVVSFDFAVAILPGWHTTIFPPYFVAGAIYSGFAMVLSLAIPVRRWFHLEDLITMRHIECMAKVMLSTGLIVAYGYAMEAFMAWYSGDPYERFTFYNRTWGGEYWWTYWLLIACNIVIPQSLWSRRVRLSVPLVFVVSLVVNVGMWLERFVIVVTSLTRDFVPSSWGIYYPTVWDWSTFAGTIGVFLSLMFLFIRGLPAISIFEMREVVHHMEPEHAHGD